LPWSVLCLGCHCSYVFQTTFFLNGRILLMSSASVLNLIALNVLQTTETCHHDGLGSSSENDSSDLTSRKKSDLGVTAGVHHSCP